MLTSQPKVNQDEFFEQYQRICKVYFKQSVENIDIAVGVEAYKRIVNNPQVISKSDIDLAFEEYFDYNATFYGVGIQDYMKPIIMLQNARNLLKMELERLIKSEQDELNRKQLIEKEKTDFINGFPQSFLDAEPNVKYKMSDLILDNFNVFVPDKPTLDEITKRATDFRKQKLAEVEAGSFDYFPWSLQSVINAFIIGFNLKSNWGYERKDI